MRTNPESGDVTWGHLSRLQADVPPHGTGSPASADKLGCEQPAWLSVATWWQIFVFTVAITRFSVEFKWINIWLIHASFYSKSHVSYFWRREHAQLQRFLKKKPREKHQCDSWCCWKLLIPHRLWKWVWFWHSFPHTGKTIWIFCFKYTLGFFPPVWQKTAEGLTACRLRMRLCSDYISWYWDV